MESLRRYGLRFETDVRNGAISGLDLTAIAKYIRQAYA